MVEEQYSAEPTNAAESVNTSAAAPADQAKSSGLAKIALILAIAAIVTAVIPFVVFVSPPIILAAIIVSIIALVKKAGTSGLRITSLILSIVAFPISIIMFFVSIFLMVPSVDGVTLDAAEVESTVTAGIEQEFGVTALVDCPDVMFGSEGSTFECSATDESGESRTVIITIEADAWYWNIAE